MHPPQTRCLILACGNTLRGDDGAGPWLAAWAEGRFRDQPGLRVVSRHQWTPELAEEIAQANSVLFVDCAADASPGQVRLIPVTPGSDTPAPPTHHLGAAELLALCHSLYDSLPRNALLLTIGAGSLEFGEKFSGPVQAALPDARALLEKTVLRFLAG